MKFKSDEEMLAWDGYAKTALIELMAPPTNASIKNQQAAFSLHSPLPKKQSIEKRAAEIADELLKLRRAREKSQA